MAKGKKASGKNEVSKGERRSSMSTRVNDPSARALNQLKAVAKGKDIVLTIENPNKEQTNRKFIKHRVSGKSYQKYMLGGAEMKGARNPLVAFKGE